MWLQLNNNNNDGRNNIFQDEICIDSVIANILKPKDKKQQRGPKRSTDSTSTTAGIEDEGSYFDLFGSEVHIFFCSQVII